MSYKYYSGDTPKNKPQSLKVNETNIPLALRLKPYWCIWAYRHNGKKWTKVPYQPNGLAASSTDYATWRSFSACLTAYKNGLGDGVGFFLYDGFCGIDYDHCVVDGLVKAEYLTRIKQADTYTELSPSGTGIRQIGYATLPSGVKRDEIEFYSEKRFLTITGNHLEGSPLLLANCQERLTTLWEFYNKKPEPTNTDNTDHSLNKDDAEILAMCASDHFDKLYRGETFGDHSRAVFDLLHSLAAYCRDAARLDSLFRASGLYCDHWVRKWERLGKDER